MILFRSFAVGHVTVAVRIVVQILGYGGTYLLVKIILAHMPRAGNATAHDLVNRIVGAFTRVLRAASWACSSSRQNRPNPSPMGFVLAVILYTLYATFVALSDLGLGGFNACHVPGPDTMTHAASINSPQDARNLIANNLYDDVSPGDVCASRCDVVQLVEPSSAPPYYNCTSWTNGTYDDPDTFQVLNLTDTSILMPRKLLPFVPGNISDSATAPRYYLYEVGPDTRHVEVPTVLNGVAAVPQDTGMLAVFGVPNLSTNMSVSLDKVLAIEFEVGCMAIGVTSSASMNETGAWHEFDNVLINDWRAYSGPEWMTSVFTNYTNQVRSIINEFRAKSPGQTLGWTGTGCLSPIGASCFSGNGSTFAAVGPWSLPILASEQNLSVSRQDALLSNCTASLHEALHVDHGVTSPHDIGENMCFFLGVSGSTLSGDSAGSIRIFSRLLCAVATQVNMVAANVTKDEHALFTVQTKRLPSDLHYLKADVPRSHALPLFIERFTLSANPSSPTSHYVAHWAWRRIKDGFVATGSGIPGRIISSFGPVVISAVAEPQPGTDYSVLRSLNQDSSKAPSLDPKAATQRIGQIAASHILASLGLNGWALLHGPLFKVVNPTGGLGTCFDLPYSIAFAPLFLSACLVTAWSIITAIRSSFHGTDLLEKGYGGMNPYLHSVSPRDLQKDVIMVWEQPIDGAPNPFLRIVPQEEPVAVESVRVSAARFLKSQQNEVSD